MKTSEEDERKDERGEMKECLLLWEREKEKEGNRENRRKTVKISEPPKRREQEKQKKKNYSKTRAAPPRAPAPFGPFGLGRRTGPRPAPFPDERVPRAASGVTIAEHNEVPSLTSGRLVRSHVEPYFTAGR